MLYKSPRMKRNGRLTLPGSWDDTVGGAAGSRRRGVENTAVVVRPLPIASRAVMCSKDLLVRESYAVSAHSDPAKFRQTLATFPTILKVLTLIDIAIPGLQL